jgi:hypothetical protein
MAEDQVEMLKASNNGAWVLLAVRSLFSVTAPSQSASPNCFSINVHNVFFISPCLGTGASSSRIKLHLDSPLFFRKKV